MHFLTARWTNLCLFTYAVDPARLAPLLPPQTTADTIDGQAFVSLVAFDFLDTKVLGVRWPGFVNFPELNLRFYVRHRSPRDGDVRGVAFVREFVPQRLVAFLARTLYNEPYVAAPMIGRVRETAAGLEVEQRLEFAGRGHTLRLRSEKPSFRPAEDSLEHFFKEHRWGFGRTRRGRLLRYEVGHPHWDCHRVRDWELNFDFGAVYGPEWADLGEQEPYSVTHAMGSPIFVSPRIR